MDNHSVTINALSEHYDAKDTNTHTHTYIHRVADTQTDTQTHAYITLPGAYVTSSATAILVAVTTLAVMAEREHNGYVITRTY